MIAEYTTFNDIRAVLGVSEEEIDDLTLGLELHNTNLLEDLEELSAYALPTWSALPAVDSRSADQARYARLFSIYCAYAVAARLLDSVEMFSFLKVADGRASAERGEEAFEKLRLNVLSQLARWRTKLLQLLAVLEPLAPAPAAAAVSWISSTGLGADPVTG